MTILILYFHFRVGPTLDPSKGLAQKSQKAASEER